MAPSVVIPLALDQLVPLLWKPLLLLLNLVIQSIRTSNPILTGSRNSLLSGGIAHDQNNTSNLFFTMPTWIIEQDENTGGQLKQLTQIISSYFDTLYAQISTLSKVKDIGYTSGSNKPFPYGERLLESLGFEAPELFANASVLAQVLQKMISESLRANFTTLRMKFIKTFIIMLFTCISQRVPTKALET